MMHVIYHEGFEGAGPDQGVGAEEVGVAGAASSPVTLIKNLLQTIHEYAAAAVR